MATLNLASEGPAIKTSYNGVIRSSVPPSTSTTTATWALFTVKAPLVNAFQSTGAKDSILRVQGTGAGELAELFEDFSEGHIQFAFVKLRDPNSGLPKNILIGWCGEGVPERTKGYFTSHLNAISKVLTGYHLQIIARSESDLDTNSILGKVADASGSKYTTGTSPSTALGTPGPPKPLATKPVFTPSPSSLPGLDPAPATHGGRTVADADHDGWGADAPPVTRTKLEKVESAYRPTKVSMSELLRNRDDSTRPAASVSTSEARPDVIKGTYQPIGKVDIAAIRAQARKEGQDDRPAPVKGAYEPVGQVDIAAIRAKAQGTVRQEAPNRAMFEKPASSPLSPPLGSERLNALPKPKVMRNFGTKASDFTGTKVPVPTGIGHGNQPASSTTPPLGSASRTFANQGGKTPAQVWAEKKSQRSGTSTTPITPASPSQSGNAGGWKSGYTGKSWSVATPTYEREAVGGPDAHALEDSSPKLQDLKVINPSNLPELSPPPQPSSPPADGPEPRDTSPPSVTRPDQLGDDYESREAPVPGDKPEMNRQPESDMQQGATTALRGDQSPIQVALPVRREVEEPSGHPPEFPTPAQGSSTQPTTTHSMQGLEPHMKALEIDDKPAGQIASDDPETGKGPGNRALVLYDYDQAEDNEIELRENEYVTNIDMVDEDWWLGTNARGEIGLFPSNYVEIVEEKLNDIPGPQHAREDTPPVVNPDLVSEGASATALYDYEAAEDNELSFPEGARITNLEFPDEDWWFGHYNGKNGLFPANYVQKSN